MTTSEQFRIYNAEGLGQALRHFREEAGLTQVQLAAMTGVPREYLIALEGGKATEQTRRLVTLLKVLGARIVVTRADW